MFLLDEVELPGHVAGGEGVVAGDHHYLWTEDKGLLMLGGDYIYGIPSSKKVLCL